ncbi:MAG: sugar ABC transporter substrate-binding protein [Spirochaetia bacterium]|jgi:multiple sugar transport system substrate-binding protein|uniref:ABC transporter-binding protein n=1 Tax=bioreactor metagenome TaxID=1076179 RepID=A0A644TPX0_9ZZZZ|nr:sugar ABC transporter substrate-binding protein [Spirochaetia bacterium]MDD3820228.1 sugar ABC transporter substrate-binding protein [Spirochaetales bacterium]NLX45364.1 sugar ABC transporter substrate-binding protein [Treponema sp.]VBB39165.1 ABC transporter, solute-binding protein [uncultured Spirochaetota bacterium]MCE1208361.1 sugar ABC transporter substrate-binding protein [Spirochaetia bacterium]
MKRIMMATLAMVFAFTAFAADKVTVTHWYWADNPKYSATMQQMAADFNATNGKGITVVAQEYPWDGGAYSETLFRAVMGGGGPDTSSFKLTSTPLFTANNLLVNLDSHLNSWKDKSLIEASLYDTMRQASGTKSVYVMPWNTQVLYVYYRPSLMKKAGIGVPKTYAEFLEAAKKLTMDSNGDGKTDVYGFGMRGAKGGQEPWGSFIWARGGNFEKMDSPQAIQGMQDYVDLFKNGYAPPTAPMDGFQEIIANFKSGKTAMTVHHIGSSAGMIETFGDDVDAFPFPGGVGKWTSMGDTENVMLKSAKNKDAAFEWLAYLATGKGQETWCTVTGNVPVSKTVKELPFFQSNRFMKVSIEGAPWAGILPILDTTTEWINNIWPNTVSAALLGKISAAEAMKKLQAGLWD